MVFFRLLFLYSLSVPMCCVVLCSAFCAVVIDVFFYHFRLFVLTLPCACEHVDAKEIQQCIFFEVLLGHFTNLI